MPHGKSSSPRLKSAREDITVNVNEGRREGGKSSILSIVLITLLVFAGAYYFVTTYVAGFVQGVQNWWAGVVNGWNNFWNGVKHPLGLGMLPIGAVLMVRKKEEKDSGSAAWLILGILFILFTLGALYVTWADYLVATAFNALGKDIWGSLLFPVAAVIIFLALAVISFRKSHELG